MPTMCQALLWGWEYPCEEVLLPMCVSRDGRYKSASKSIMLGGRWVGVRVGDHSCPGSVQGDSSQGRHLCDIKCTI